MSEPATDVTADSSPAAEITLDSLSPSDLASWRQTGQFPTDAAADSSPAVVDAPPASTEASPAPASEPGPPAKKGAETRKAELAAEIQDLLRQRAELRRDLTTPPPAPDVSAASSPAPARDADKPTWATFEDQIGTTYATWGAAQDAFSDARDAWRDRQQSVVAQVQTVEHTASQRIQAFVAETPDFWARVSPDVGTLQPLSIARLNNPQLVRSPRHDIAEVVVTSEFTPQWMLHLSEHPDVLQSLLTLPSPEAVYRVMGRIEATFATPPQVSEPAAPVPVTPVSSAPPPPTTLGTKPGAPRDEVDAALAAGDFSAYRRAMNAREIAQRR